MQPITRMKFGTGNGQIIFQGTGNPRAAIQFLDEIAACASNKGATIYIASSFQPEDVDVIQRRLTDRYKKNDDYRTWLATPNGIQYLLEIAANAGMTIVVPNNIYPIDKESIDLTKELINRTTNTNDQKARANKTSGLVNY